MVRLPRIGRICVSKSSLMSVRSPWLIALSNHLGGVSDGETRCCPAGPVGQPNSSIRVSWMRTSGIGRPWSNQQSSRLRHAGRATSPSTTALREVRGQRQVSPSRTRTSGVAPRRKGGAASAARPAGVTSDRRREDQGQVIGGWVGASPVRVLALLCQRDTLQERAPAAGRRLEREPSFPVQTDGVTNDHTSTTARQQLANH